MRKFLCLVLLTVAGCQSSVQSADDKAERMWTAAEPYYKCVIYRADAIALQPEDPYYLAIAAKAHCASERSEVVDAIHKIYNYQIWQRLVSSMDRRVEEAAITRIVNRRRTG